MKHLIASQQLDRKTIEDIFRIADRLQKKESNALKGKIMASLFYEPSTRTRLSFESAMLRLGGTVVSTENAKEFSSAAKGESIEDTIRVVGGYADVIVIRHFEQGTSARAAAISSVPIINAGDGAGQHPTQALLDLYTIRKELGKIDGVTVAFVGDLKNGRTVRSLSYLLGKYRNVKICFISPKALRVGEDIKEYLKRHHVEYKEMEVIDSAIGKIDVLYQTRIQKERFATLKEYEKYKGRYILTLKEVKKMKKRSIIMHPLPRVNEIAPEVDRDPRAAYFRQARNGLYVRMALLQSILAR